jgi:hypothetical protein
MMSIQYVIGEECPCCTGFNVKDTHTALLVDGAGMPILFETKIEAIRFVTNMEEKGKCIDKLMIIPEMEVL